MRRTNIFDMSHSWPTKVSYVDIFKSKVFEVSILRHIKVYKEKLSKHRSISVTSLKEQVRNTISILTCLIIHLRVL